MTPEYLQKQKEIPLNGRQVLELVDGKANVVLYRDLCNMNNIDEVLGPFQAAFILFEFTDKMGHWVSLYRNGDTVSFFNSYGDPKGYPDDTLSVIDEEYRKESCQKFPMLSELLLNSPYKLQYNDVKLQKYGRTIMTCGRWCALFIMMRNQHIDVFSKIFKSDVGDDIVTILTMWVTKD